MDAGGDCRRGGVLAVKNGSLEAEGWPEAKAPATNSKDARVGERLAVLRPNLHPSETEGRGTCSQ